MGDAKFVDPVWSEYVNNPETARHTYCGTRLRSSAAVLDRQSSGSDQRHLCLRSRDDGWVAVSTDGSI
jgi:hypothetical protein